MDFSSVTQNNVLRCTRRFLEYTESCLQECHNSPKKALNLIFDSEVTVTLSSEEDALWAGHVARLEKKGNTYTV
jgi:hypothetical protein